ncbi:MAG: rhomboid family intramembrane serine protease [Spartobacteria bacterium]
MTILDRLEKTLGRFAIPGLIRYVVALNALVFILLTLQPDYIQALQLDPGAFRNGEIWRAVTWIFIPETMSFFWILFYLIFTWWLGDMLEESWGVFRLNAYYFLGMAFCIVSALLFGAAGGNFFLNLSRFLASATLAPNFEILLFMIIPVKMKWVALFSLIVPAGYLLFGPLDMKMMVVMCLGNYLLFFAPAFLKNRAESVRNGERRKRFEKALHSEQTIHCCEACKITEVSNPDAEFRVSADGKEYCTEHLPSRAKQA